MAWKTEEEKQQERAEKQRLAAEAEAERARQVQAAQDARAAAEFAASPLGRATTAHQSNDKFFQLELAVSELRGGTSFFGSSSNVIQHTGAATDLLGQIEDVGWHLEHVGYVFIETGATSTNRVLSTGQGTVTEGNVTGIYLFRRA
ncbi:MAG TPA: hypothetical protein VGI56_01790 [Galbitalea sp.]|jgi:hypothetical protein